MLHMGGPTYASVTLTFHPSHTLFFKAETGKAFTTFLASLALTITTFFPAFVAAFMRVLILQTPGIVNTPSPVMMNLFLYVRK